MVSPTVPREPLFGQSLALCDYYPTSLKIAGPDICMVVGDSAGFGEIRFCWIANTYDWRTYDDSYVIRSSNTSETIRLDLPFENGDYV